jgi:hypothetical protein
MDGHATVRLPNHALLPPSFCLPRTIRLELAQCEQNAVSCMVKNASAQSMIRWSHLSVPDLVFLPSPQACMWLSCAPSDCAALDPKTETHVVGAFDSSALE